VLNPMSGRRQVQPGPRRGAVGDSTGTAHGLR